MSVPVDLGGLRDEISNFGSEPYLISVTAEGRPHAVAVVVEWQDQALSVGAGSTTLVNVAERPAVSLLWPPTAAGGYSLIVDGRAGVAPGVDRIMIEPIKAVLHRRRAEGRGSDCVTVLAGNAVAGRPPVSEPH